MEEILEKGKKYIKEGYRTISLRKTRPYIVFVDKKGNQKSISVRKLSEEERMEIVNKLREYRKKIEKKEEERKREMEMKRIEEEREREERKRKKEEREKKKIEERIKKEAFEIGREIWNTPKYLYELITGGVNELLLRYSDINPDEKWVKSYLEWRLTMLGEDLVKKGREEGKVRYLILGNVLLKYGKDIVERGVGNLWIDHYWKSFREAEEVWEDFFNNFLLLKYIEVGIRNQRDILTKTNIFYGILFEYMGIPQELWDEKIRKGYQIFKEYLDKKKEKYPDF